MKNDLEKLREEVLDTDACTACGTCVSLCPNIISVEDRITGIGNCNIEQGRCYRYCPRTSMDSEMKDLFGDIDYGGMVGPHLTYHVAQKCDNISSGVFQYGGTVSALLIHAMNRGMINGAVVTKTQINLPVPIFVKSEKHLMNAAGSKYAVSPTNMEVNRILKNPKNRIGVVALPCQVTGLRKRQRLSYNDREEGKISLIIGLFCTWALSQQGWRMMHKRYIGRSTIKRADIPPPPGNTMEITTRNRTVNIPLDEVKEHIRPGCKVCLDMCAENADISIGMVERQPDRNTVIVRTQVGQTLFQDANRSDAVRQASLDDRDWKHLNHAAANKKKRAIVEAERRGLILPYYRRIIGLKSIINK